MATYRVFHVYTHGARDHEAIFVETHENGTGSGHTYHVTGNILMGMTYEHKRATRPDDRAEFHEKRDIGHVKQSDYERVELICRGIAVPGRQLNLKGQKLDPTKPVRRCGEWAADAIQELRDQGVLNE
ncbi:hypothetical protein Z517_07363 [Fonsecaea pedrosoi CBS 271.37]|uniref:Uncharacterized protein n=1 Tax=Fonsecaea pedrosoi CBS 271.37 TaxID=1442368 RepID=A0A0D2F257_9EURO|nr:uncharacterized protein Z517_07363 [Fonsecaea pedrosoi CBS 271.37]KIW80747.1 hypothetical protein Z517_07363 [Fonsecaea pedrosoi CBS 271.37]